MNSYVSESIRKRISRESVYQKRIPGIQAETIEITIEGAVESPGVYQFKPGISLREVVEVARLCKNADKRKLKWNKIYFSSERVEIPKKNPHGNKTY